MPIDLSGNTITSSRVSAAHTAFTTRLNKDGLCVYLDAGNSNSFNGSGNWIDLSGFGNHCVWTSAPTWSSSGYFTFTSNYGTITSNQTNLNFSMGQTLIIVMRKSANASRQNPWNQAYGGYGTWTCETNGVINQYFGDSGGNDVPYIGISSNGIDLNVWNIMGATRNLNEHIWYKNGTITLTTHHTYGQLATTLANITIGSGYAGAYVGDIAMILAYNKALQPYEMAENYNAIKERFNLT